MPVFPCAHCGRKMDKKQNKDRHEAVCPKRPNIKPRSEIDKAAQAASLARARAAQALRAFEKGGNAAETQFHQYRFGCGWRACCECFTTNEKARRHMRVCEHQEPEPSAPEGESAKEKDSL